MQKKVKIKSNSIQNARKVTWMQKRVKIKYDSIKVKFSVLQNTMVVIWRKKIISSPTHQRMPWCSPACKGKGWQLRRNFACSFFVALMTRLASMTRFLPSISITDVATAHIFFRDFWTILLESKIFILPLSLSAANWESFLKHWRAFEVSLSLFWNNSNVFS